MQPAKKGGYIMSIDIQKYREAQSLVPAIHRLFPTLSRGEIEDAASDAYLSLQGGKVLKTHLRQAICENAAKILHRQKNEISGLANETPEYKLKWREYCKISHAQKRIKAKAEKLLELREMFGTDLFEYMFDEDCAEVWK
jgi:hypothetical protein